ncbi:MAG: alpha/beta hydrolase [Ruminococcaceae bacterium]|nr:alpha/beta hydrolase [Oscillospiraceae bacterium]
MRKAMRRIAVAAAVGTAAVLAASAYAYREAFGRDPKRQADMEEIPEGEQFDRYREEMLRNIRRTAAVEYERVTVTSHDGLTLAGKYYAGEAGAPLMIFFHGYRSTPERDASGGLHFCREKGWHVLLVEQRAHGESEGKTITFGIRERYDCLAWVHAMNARLGEDTPVFLWGISMGASTVLMAAGLDLPPNVRGVAADCGFSGPEEILKATVRKRKLPLAPTWQLLRLGARLYGGFDAQAETAVDALGRAKVPVLLIHGEGDSIVPCEMVHKLAEACASPVTVVTVPTAEHGISWYVDMPAYLGALEKFCADNIK